MLNSDSAGGRDRLKAAVGCNSPLSRQGVLEYLFAWMFKGLVYPQIWEDPEIDLEALAITPQSHVVAIASGGCNILSYLIADPQRITAVDLNKTHVALGRLKLAAAANLPGWDAFYRFFGEADEKANVNAYWRFLSPALDAETRAYWEGARLRLWPPPHLAVFSQLLPAWRAWPFHRRRHTRSRGFTAWIRARCCARARSRSSAAISRNILRRCSTSA